MGAADPARLGPRPERARGCRLITRVDVSESDMWPVMFNAVGGELHLLRRRVAAAASVGLPRSRPSTAWPTTGRSATTTSSPTTTRSTRSSASPASAATPPTPKAWTTRCRRTRWARRASKPPQAANALGWHWWPGTNAIPSQKYKTLEQCARWGACEWGCPQGAKASFDLIYMPQALQAGRQGDHRCPGAQDRHRTTTGTSHRRGVHRPRRRRAPAAGPRGRVVRQRHRHPAAAAAVGDRPAPGRSGQLLGPGRPQPDAAPELQR